MSDDSGATFSACVFGRVSFDQTDDPVTDAEFRVGVYGDNGILAMAVVRTDADGRYEAPLEWPGHPNPTVELQCRHPAAAFIPFQAADEPFDRWHPRRLSDGERLERNLSVADGFTLDLTVTDGDGRPIGDAYVGVIVTDDRSCCWPFYDRVTDNPDRDAIYPRTDANGRCRLVGLAFEYRPDDRTVIAVHHDDFAEELIQRPKDLPRSGHIASLTVRLGRGQSLIGRVVSLDSGQPVEGAEVTAWLLTTEADACPPCHPIRQQVQSDTEGRFELRGLHAREHHLRVEHDDFTAEVIESLSIPIVAELTIALQSGRSVSGRVIDRDGRPAAGAAVEAFVPSSSPIQPMPAKKTKTDDAGRFRMGGLPDDAPVWLLAERDGYMGGILGFAPLGTDTQEVVLDARQLVEVAARVVDPDTNEPFREHVWCRAFAVTSAGREMIGYFMGDEADGCFSVLLPPNGSYRLRLTWDAYPAGSPFFKLLDVEMADGHPEQLGDIVGDRPCELTVHVVDGQTGQPVAGASVEVNPRRLEWAFSTCAETDEEGAGVVARLPRGEMAVVVGADGYKNWKNIDIVLPHEEAIRVELKCINAGS